jgi:hypothetical protein
MSRLDLLHAMASGKINIDRYHDNTPDFAEYEGHYFSDKAPGTVAATFPAFLASAFLLQRIGIPLDSDRGWLGSSWIACAGSINVIAAIGAGLLFAWLTRYVGQKAALITVLAIFLGAAPLPYGTMMFSHSLVIGLVCIAVWAIAKPTGVASCDGHSSWLRRNRWDLLAGLACGWALASEFTAGPVMLGLFLWMCSRDWRRAIPFCLAAAPPMLLVPGYSLLCFGNPFILPYSLNTSFPQMNEGFFSIKWPDCQTGYSLLFSPARGLFFWTPFFLIAGLGYWQLAQTKRALFGLAYGIPLLQIVIISGRTWDWLAGPTLGPRYLAPMIPLLALPCALGVQRLPRAGLCLAIYSVLITTVATFTDAAPSGSFNNPLRELHIPRLMSMDLAPNLWTILGLSPCLSLVLFYLFFMGFVCWLWHRVGKVEGGPGRRPLH